MKLKRFKPLRSPALIAVGVFLGRAAQADTVIDFDVKPLDQPFNNQLIQTLGDNASASSDSVTVTGFGTPNIGLTWTGFNGNDQTRWDYYADSVWSAGQLNQSTVGSTHQVTFAPNNPGASVIIKSFNFHPYYTFATYGERFSYNVSVVAGTNVLAGPTSYTFQSDATKNHPVNINYTGAPGQTLKLRITRVASTLGAGENEGDPADIAVDDITFAQTPTTALPPGPQVVVSRPADDEFNTPAGGYSFFASITNGTTAPVSSSIKLKLDGVSVTPTVSAANDLTNVSYQVSSPLLVPGSTHIYTLSYTDTAAGNYTNLFVFTAAPYATLPANYGLPAGSGNRPGFTYRTVAARSDTPTLDSTIARARQQLAGTLIDPDTSMPYTNAATAGTNADGSFSIDTVLNFNDNGTQAGNFFDDQPFPGLDSGLPVNWFSTEARLYLQLAAGFYRFGVNSDDGFELDVLPRQGTAGPPIVLGLYDNGRSAADTFCDVLVPVAGLYPFDLIYFESGGDASCEFYSVNLLTRDKFLVNDATNQAIKSFQVPAPFLTQITRSGANVVLDWAYGTPPFQVQLKTNITDANWTDVGSTTSQRTATIPLQPGTRFFRVRGQ